MATRVSDGEAIGTSTAVLATTTSLSTTSLITATTTRAAGVSISHEGEDHSEIDDNTQSDNINNNDIDNNDNNEGDDACNRGLTMDPPASPLHFQYRRDDVATHPTPALQRRQVSLFFSFSHPFFSFVGPPTPILWGSLLDRH